MKRVIFIVLSICLCSQMFAQRLQERRVYYLDCSYSMVKPNKIWDKVCENLINAIDNVEDETTELFVIPFAFDGNDHDVLDAYQEFATQEGKNQLKAKIKAIKPSTTSMTYHKNPINDFYNNHRVTGNRITYMFLMTDGKDEWHDKTIFPNKLRQWQSLYGSQNVYGFYVMLEKSARNPQVSDIINTTDHLWEVETADVNINLIRFEDGCKFNVRTDEYVDIPVFGKIEHLTFDVSCEDNCYKIKQIEKESDFIRLYINHPNCEVSSLPRDEQIIINIKAKDTQKFDFLVTERIHVLCHNKKVKGIRPTFNKGKKIEKLGKVTYHPNFWWSKEKTIPLTDTLHLHFNADAKNENGHAEFEIVDIDGMSIPQEDLHIFIGGKELKDHKFKVQHTDDDIALTFQYEPSAKSGKHQGWLRLINHNLDQDGDTELTSSQPNNSLHWQIQYEKNMNPLAKCLMWIGIIIVVCLLMWFIFIKPIKYPRFKTYKKSILVSQKGQIVYNKTCQFKGAKMVVFADKKEKQSFLNRIFTGRIDTYVNPLFTQKIVFVPKKKGKQAFVRAVGYSIMPNPIPQMGVAIIKNANIEININ